MKRFIALSMCMIMVMVLFTGCVNKTPQNAESPTAVTEKTEESAASTVETPEEVSQPITIKMLGFKRMDEVDYLFEDFKTKEPNITIEYESLAADKLNDVLKTRLVGGIGPDIFQFDNENSTQVQEYEKAGFYEDLSNEPYLNNLNDGMVDLLKITSSGKVYAIPMASKMWGVYYNKDNFKKAGITDVPKTWAEFIEVCEKLKVAGLAPIGGGFKDGWPLSVYPAYVQVNLVPLAEVAAQENKLNTGEMKYSDPDGYKRQLLTKISELAKKEYFLNGSLGLNYDGGMQAFANDKCSMILMGPWATTQILAINPEMNMGVFSLPSNDEPVDKVKIWGGPADPWAINKNATPEAKAAAKKFFAYLCTKEANELYVNKTVQFPVVKGAVLKVEDPFVAAPTNDFAKYLDSILSTNVIVDNQTPGYKAAGTKYSEYLSMVVSKPDTSVDQALNDCDKQFEAAGE